MSNRLKLVRGGTRVATGLAIATVGVLAVIGINGAQIPDADRSVPEYSVSTQSTSSNTLVCTGSFGVLGVNASAPNEVTPVGTSHTKLSSEEVQGTVLRQDLEGGTPPAAYTVPGAETIRGAQSQRVTETSVKGMTAASCGEATSEQWLVGGSTVRGISSVITLSNPGQVPATVNLTVYDESGQVEGVGTTGVLVPAGAQKTLPLSGFGVGRESPAVRVQASGSPVFATLGVHQITDITPIGADTLNAQYGPQKRLVFAGVKAFEEHTHDDEGDGAHPMASVRLLSPQVDTHATFFGVTADGEHIELGAVDLQAGVVADTGVRELPNHVTAIIVDSDDPVVGGVTTSVHNGNDYDFMWMTPSTIFEPEESVDAVTLQGGQLTVVNLSGNETEFMIGENTIMFPGHAAKRMNAAEVATISGNAPFAIGVTLFDEHSISSYPVLGSTQQIEEFTVFTR